MKRCIAVGFATLAAVVGYAQEGTVSFANVGNRLNAPDYASDSMTRLAGPQYMAELRASFPDTNNFVGFATTTFLEQFPGYFLGGEVTLNTCGSAFIQINIWNTNAGVSFEQAKASGLTNAWAQSGIIYVSPLGGWPCCDPPCVSPTLYGLTSLRLNGPYTPPQLDITVTGSGVIQLTWPFGIGNFVVAQNRDLQSTNWTILTNIPSTIISTNYVSIPPPRATTFFRLVSQ